MNSPGTALLSPALEVEKSHRPTMDSNFDYSRRVEAKGKFLYLGNEKFWVKGVTYGTFNPNASGEPFPSPQAVASDFEAMSLAGINTVRVYTPPPPWFLNLAQENGLRLIVGLAWEQHVTFLDNRELAKSIEQRMYDDVLACNEHPAILAYSLGNEIPVGIVRWHGRRKIEAFIKRLYNAVKRAHPDSLVTYVNYPTTEYLQLHFLDLCCFNLYLESVDILQDCRTWLATSPY